MTLSKLNRSMIVLTGIYISLIAAPPLYACSFDIYNLFLNCKDQYYAEEAYNPSDLQDALSQCSNFSDAKKSIEATLNESDVIYVHVSDKAPDEENDWSHCYINTTAQVSNIFITATSTQPYCVQPILYCGGFYSYTVSPFQKIWFDLTAGHIFLPVLIIIASITGAIAGIYLAQEKMLPPEVKSVVLVLQISGIAILILLTVLIMDSFRMPFINDIIDSLRNLIVPYGKGVGALIFRGIFAFFFFIYLVSKIKQQFKKSLKKNLLMITASVLLAPYLLLLFFAMLYGGILLNWILYPPMPIFILRVGLICLILSFFIGKKRIWKLPVYYKI